MYMSYIIIIVHMLQLILHDIKMPKGANAARTRGVYIVMKLTNLLEAS